VPGQHCRPGDTIAIPALLSVARTATAPGPRDLL